MKSSGLEPQIAEMFDFAQTTVTQAREVALKWFRQAPEIMTKDDESPVTIADRSVEQFLRDAILQRYPDHGMLGEEFGLSHLDAQYIWSIDPIDGTRSFISGNPLWGCLVALLRDGVPVFGIIDIPFTGERWVGAHGQGCQYGGVACRTRQSTRLEDAILYATSPDIFTQQEQGVFDALTQAVYLRRFGGDCYSYALLALGQVDLVVEAGLQPYDYLALRPVIEEAGGVITDWTGQPVTMHSDGRVIAAANLAIHRAALEIIATK
ncbi:histidinol-phosphatase [Alcaligenaceae bacterium CGII-47]|nr:histidinol-phosphatase [Alcaligenaceae bacterium CGII-47]